MIPANGLVVHTEYIETLSTVTNIKQATSRCRQPNGKSDAKRVSNCGEDMDKEERIVVVQTSGL